MQGGRANKDDCVVGELKPHMILQFNAITSGSVDLPSERLRAELEGRRAGCGTQIKYACKTFRGRNGVGALQVGH